jgi:hypothetical protein
LKAKLYNGIPSTVRRTKNIKTLSRIPKIATPPGKELILVDVLGADEAADGVAFLEAALQVASVKMDTEPTPLVATSR